jgi:hypothetical protein
MDRSDRAQNLLVEWLETGDGMNLNGKAGPAGWFLKKQNASETLKR